MLSDDVEEFERAEMYRERISLMKFKQKGENNRWEEEGES